MLKCTVGFKLCLLGSVLSKYIFSCSLKVTVQEDFKVLQMKTTCEIPVFFTGYFSTFELPKKKKISHVDKFSYVMMQRIKKDMAADYSHTI